MIGLLIACLVLNIVSMVLIAVSIFGYIDIDNSHIFVWLFALTIISTYVLNIVTIIKCLGRLV